MLFFVLVINIVSFYYNAMADDSIESNVLHRADMLSTVITIEENVTRFDYVDEKGKITYAADKRYATRIQIKNNRSIIEEYFDAEGLPAKQLLGHYALIRDYNEKEEIIRQVYLDSSGQPIINYDGYAITKRYYNDAGLLETELFFDNYNKPITTRSFGNGCKRIYDNSGNVIAIVCLNADGEPSKTVKGYAIIQRSYYTEGPYAGKIETEKYFDENNNPVQLAKQQYGIYKEYDEYGRVNLITYLNNSGEPVISSDGYATCKQTFYADDTVRTETYYDEFGNPIALSEGQYGTFYQDNKKVYLDINGCELFSLKNFLHNNHAAMIIICFIAIVIPAISGRKTNIFLLAGYIMIVLYLTMMFRNHLDRRMELKVFWSYKQFFSNEQIRWQITENIFLFIPLGIMMYEVYPDKKALFILIAISIVIELCQYFAGLGLCELDDTISNGIGGFVGFELGKLTTNLKVRIKKCKHKYFA